MIISIQTAKKLKEMGCDVPTDLVHTQYYMKANNGKLTWCQREENKTIDKKRDIWNYHKTDIPTYDLTEIILDAKMAKAFFGERSDLVKNHGWKMATERLLDYIHEKKQEKAEEYLLWSCIFNLKIPQRLILNTETLREF